MIRNILNLYCLFIDRWKHFSKCSKLFVKAFCIGASLEVLRVLPDWTQHWLCNIKTIRNVFYIWYLCWPALLMKASRTADTQNPVMIAAVVSTWIGTGVIFAIKSISLKTCTSRAILNLDYLPITCWELQLCSIFNKIINLVEFSALIPSRTEIV